jgi:hypothetical protein
MRIVDTIQEESQHQQASGNKLLVFQDIYSIFFLTTGLIIIDLHISSVAFII